MIVSGTWRLESLARYVREVGSFKTPNVFLKRQETCKLSPKNLNLQITIAVESLKALGLGQAGKIV